jgi:hypothetical protein
MTVRVKLPKKLIMNIKRIGAKTKLSGGKQPVVK